MILGHGNDIHHLCRELKADFSSNVAYNNHSDKILSHLTAHINLINNYPDPGATALTHKIAQHHGVKPCNVLVTNGSAEAFYLVAHYFADKNSVVAYPSFAEYEDACRVHRHRLTFVPIEDIIHYDSLDADTIWFATPNNPDGNLTSEQSITNLCQRLPHTAVIIDTAYSELCPFADNISLIHTHCSNLITIHSLTKSFAIPGIRLGYIIASDDIVREIAMLRIPWSVNSLAQEAGCYIIDHYVELLPDIGQLYNESLELQKAVAAIPQMEVVPSKCNYFLAKMCRSTAQELKDFLITKGLLIRNASNFRGLSAQHIRLSVQGWERNALLLEGIKEFFV